MNTTLTPSSILVMLCVAFIVVLIIPSIFYCIALLFHFPLLYSFFVGVYIGFLIQLLLFLKTKNFIKKTMLIALLLNFSFAHIVFSYYYQLYRGEGL
jgi:hypothetical protein